ncbi:kinesin-like protein KIF20B [Cephus cinctus]|uniref:Kinesin-like protein KIF20B n=1 Tax=Cephus cinctus TaxID=211228 RepID=A0AAJ7RKS1_CEPCN|nr:kinesin-like protein KIF20B [Cephus cinctus]
MEIPSRSDGSSMERLTERSVGGQSISKESEDELQDYNRSLSLQGDSCVNCNQTVKVYLRLKPGSDNYENSDMYTITNSTTLLTKLSTAEGAGGCQKRGKHFENPTRRFTFARTFGPECSQAQLFDQAVKQQMVDFLTGQSSTVMNYGTINAGKSYTMLGTLASPGIIPRGIKLTFSTLNCTLFPWYKPSPLNGAIGLVESERIHETELRRKFIADAIDKTQWITAFESFQTSGIEGNEIFQDALYSVWVSFGEIYNETAYDLLAENESKHLPLTMVTDKHGSTFIKGLRMISATTDMEAYKIFMIGQSRLKVASTMTNPKSSRSQAIFTIRLLKYFNDFSPDEVEISSMNFCDLPGFGQSRRTLNIGKRLKEAQNINSSLLVLGRCLKAVLNSQMSRENGEICAPFRESKLTRLFQKALSGKEFISFIVNLNPTSDLHADNQSVLSFCNIAKKIAINPSMDLRKSTVSEINFQSSHTTIGKLDKAKDEITEKSCISERTGYAKLKGENEMLKKEVANLKNSMFSRELEVRQEMVQSCTEVIKELEAEWRSHAKEVEKHQENLLKWSVNQVEDFYKERISNINQRKRRRTENGKENEEDKATIEELEIENAQLISKILGHKETIRELTKDSTKIETEKNQSNFENSLLRKELKDLQKFIESSQDEGCDGENSECLTDQLKNLINTKDDKIKTLKKSLDQSKEEYVRISAEVIRAEMDLLGSKKVLSENSTKVKNLEDKVSEKSNYIGMLQSQLNVQRKQLIDSEIEIQEFQDKLNKSELKVSILSRRVEKFENSDYALSAYANAKGDDSLLENDLNQSDSKLLLKESRSEDNSKNDSGIIVNRESESQRSTCTTNSIKSESDDKGSQTIGLDQETKKGILEELESLQQQHETLKVKRVQEIQKTNELHEELEFFKKAANVHERNTDTFMVQAKEYELKYREASKDLEARSREYENVIRELREKLEISQESENRTSRCLEEYLEKSDSLGSQLSVAYGELERASVKCFTQHVPKIDKLEKECLSKSQKIIQLEERIVELEKDQVKLVVINDRLKDLDELFERSNRDKMNSLEEINRRKEFQLFLEEKLEEFKKRIDEREQEIASLQEKLQFIVKELIRSEDDRRTIERDSRREIGKLRAHLLALEKNAAFLNAIHQEDECRRNEVDGLKILLQEKDREMNLLKKHRDKTIRRYESLVRHLQGNVERCKQESMRTRKVQQKKLPFYKQCQFSESKYVKEDSSIRSSASLQTIDTSTPRGWRKFSRKRESFIENSKPQEVKRKSDLEIISGEYRIPERNEDSSAITVSTTDESLDEYHRITRWMEIRRSNGKTKYLVQKNEVCIDVEPDDDFQKVPNAEFYQR